jgi:penicillin-binding protein 2
VHQFGPVVTGHVPVSAANLAAIQRAMAGVTTEPFGTAIATFRNYQYSVAGKTGTAEVDGGVSPQAWFAALTPAKQPRLALAVLVENGGEGAVAAAPIARAVIDAFYKYTDRPPRPQPTPLTVP